LNFGPFADAVEEDLGLFLLEVVHVDVGSAPSFAQLLWRLVVYLQRLLLASSFIIGVEMFGFEELVESVIGLVLLVVGLLILLVSGVFLVVDVAAHDEVVQDLVGSLVTRL